MGRLRKVAIFASVIAASVGMSAGLDTQNLPLWAISVMWLTIVGIAQVYEPENKKRHGSDRDAKHD